MTKDDAKARSDFTAARAEQEKLVRAHPDDAGALCVLGLIDAALGRKEEALREGRRAVELLPMEKDAINGTRLMVALATNRCIGWRQRSRLRTAWNRHSVSGFAKLWHAQADAVVGSVARRSVLRKNRRLPGAKVILW